MGAPPSRYARAPPRRWRFSSQGVTLPSLKRLGPSPRGLAHIVTAVLPKYPIRALKLRDRTFRISVIHEHRAGYRRARSSAASPPPVRFGGVSGQGVFILFFTQSEKEPSSRGLTYFVAAALPKSPICARKLGDRTTPISVAHGPLAGFRHA